jgi:hypothetical protein
MSQVEDLSQEFLLARFIRENRGRQTPELLQALDKLATIVQEEQAYEARYSLSGSEFVAIVQLLHNVGVQRRPAHDGRDPQDGLGPSAATTGSASGAEAKGR